MSTLQRRVISAAVLAPVVMGLVYAGGWSFTAFVALASVLLTVEWDRLTGGGAAVGTRWLVVVQALAVAVTVLVAGFVSIKISAGLLLLSTVALALLARALSRAWVWAALGTAWIAVPSIALLWLRARTEVGFELVLGLLLAVWACDTGAYFVGRAVGGPRLAPKWSPKKTWAGLGGGALGAALVAAVWASWTEMVPVAVAAIAGVAVAVIAQLGDLSESAVKRHFAVKDSGTLIPGHGGLLDRVDGLLFAAPTVALLALLGGRG